jgi:hypothetical protein
MEHLFIEIFYFLLTLNKTACFLFFSGGFFCAEFVKVIEQIY